MMEESGATPSSISDKAAKSKIIKYYNKKWEERFMWLKFDVESKSMKCETCQTARQKRH